MKQNYRVSRSHQAGLGDLREAVHIPGCPAGVPVPLPPRSFILKPAGASLAVVRQTDGSPRGLASLQASTAVPRSPGPAAVYRIPRTRRGVSFGGQNSGLSTWRSPEKSAVSRVQRAVDRA